MDAVSEFIGESAAVQAVRDQLRRLLARREGGRRLPAILITGETGTGKGLLARILHRSGPRAGGPFVDVNCAAIPETLLEAELFGYERGAFTDARRSKPGLFQTAHRGMLFLDEIGLLPPGLQAKLLKVLEENAVRRLGATAPEPVDVWVISATNADLKGEVSRHAFREDLYHRLAVLTLRLPPLRERGRDVVMLAERFLARVCTDYGLPEKRFGPDAVARLLAYRWPGNVRELNNVIERAALLAEKDVITAEALELQAEATVEPRAAAGTSRRPSLDDAMREHLVAALDETGWNISQTSKLLGISRNTLRARMDRFNLDRPGERPRRAKPVEPLPEPEAASEPTEPVPAPLSSTLRWEQRRITLLRCVLVIPSGFEGMSSASRALEVLIDKVNAFGGRVEELSATGLLASFGLETPEDAPRRAALAALAIKRMSDRAAREGPVVPRLRAALHVAEARVAYGAGGTKIDSEESRALGATLDTLAAASRPDDIVVSMAAAPFLERRFDLTPDARTASGGAFYRLTGRERRGFELLGRPGTFVGRRQELDLLQNRLRLALDGRGQVVALVGEPGVGKSRLVWEFVRAQGSAAGLVLEAAAAAHASAVPLFVVRDLLRGYFHTTEQDTAADVAGKVKTAVLELDDALGFAIPALERVLDASVDDPAWQTLVPAERRRQTFEAVKRLLLRESRRRPLLLVLDDLHWIDAESQAFLDTLVEGVPAAHIMVLLTCRPEYRHGWGGMSFYTQLSVAPLPVESAHELLDGLLGREAALLPVKERLIEWAGGNPFFLEEISRSVIETGVLVGDRGAYRLARPLTDVEVPSTVEEVLAARVARLAEGSRDVLDAAAVIGKEVSLILLRHVVTLEDTELFQGVRQLQAAELLYETASFPDVEYAFKHALTHEVTYRMIAAERRRDLHARVMEALERLAPDDVQRLGDHAFRAERWTRAVRYLRQAGLDAAAQGANHEAVALLEQALAALAHVPETREAIEQAIDLRFDIRNALQPLGDLGRIIASLREAEALAERLGDERRLGWVASYLTEHYRMAGEPDLAAAAGRRALEIGERVDDLAMRVVTNLPLGLLYRALGDYRRAIEFLGWNTARLVGDLRYDRFGLFGLPSVFSRAFTVLCLAELGEFRQAAVIGRESIALAEEVGQPFSRVYAGMGMGALYLRQGDFDRAIPMLEECVALARATSIPVGFVYGASHFGYALTLCGRVAEGVAVLEEAVERSAAMKLVAGHSAGVAYLGEAYLLSGRIDDASVAAEQALELARHHGERGNEAYARRLLAEVARARDDVSSAIAAYRQALALVEELGMRPLAAHCHRGLARALRHAGEHAAASAEMDAAAVLFEKLEMRSWAERLAAERRSDADGSRDTRG
jgi:transcriptional regulator with AAA-type ATPase domain/tetratricopeptide (TPR) repeat protein